MSGTPKQEQYKAATNLIEMGRDTARRETWYVSKYFVIAHAFLTALMIQGVIILKALNVAFATGWLIPLLFLIHFGLIIWYSFVFSEKKKDANPPKN